MIRLLLCLILIAVPVRAEMPSGHDDPRYNAAVEAWLAGDDLTSLPALYALAREGNTAAQILLARIRYTHLAEGPWLSSLPYRSKRALFREPSGGFGRSWLFAVGEHSPLAEALNDTGLDDPNPQTLPTLLAFEETRAAYRVSERLIAAGRSKEVLEHLDGKTDAPSLIRMSWYAAVETGVEPKVPLPRETDLQGLEDAGDIGLANLESWAHTMNSGTTLKAVSAQLCGAGQASDDHWLWALMGSSAEDGSVVEDAFVKAVADTPEVLPLATLCRTHCDHTFLPCFRTGHEASRGLQQQRRLGSPVETLITNTEWQRSVRAQMDAIDLIRFFQRGAELSSESEPRRLDQCLADVVAKREG